MEEIRVLLENMIATPKYSIQGLVVILFEHRSIAVLAKNERCGILLLLAAPPTQLAIRLRTERVQVCIDIPTESSTQNELARCM
jgi:hypothetical protein